MKMFGISTCSLLMLILLCAKVRSDGYNKCTMFGVEDAPDSTKPQLATDCIAPDPLKAARAGWTPYNDYSYGGADDFCLHTQISDDKDILESRKRVYRGVGSNFPIIQKLIRGNAWSFQREGRLETVNMDWDFAKIRYNELVDKLTAKFLAEAKKHTDDMTYWKMIKELHKTTAWDYKGTEFLKLNTTFYELHSELWQPSTPPSVPEPGIFHVDPKASTKAGATTRKPGIYIENTATYGVATKLIGYSTDSAGIWQPVYSTIMMKPSEMLALMKELEDKFKDGGFNWPVDINDPYLNDLTKLDPSKTNAEFYKQIREAMQSQIGLLWKKYREDKYYKWRREKFMEMHTQYSLIQQELRSRLILHCFNYSNTVKHHFRHLGHLIDNIQNNPFAAQKGAPNPYFVEVSAITVNHELLKNFLHIRVFMNRSESDEKPKLHTEEELQDKAKGRMKAVIIIVKDQEGFPVGDFGRPIPCDRTCDSYSGPVHRHDTYRNDLPCVFTPPTANSHPGVYIYPGSDKNKQEPYEGIRELHATWNFAQDSCNFVTELHIQTLILEELNLELPGTDRFDSAECIAQINDAVTSTKPTADPLPHCITAKSNCVYPGRKPADPKEYHCLNRTDNVLLTDWLTKYCKHQGRGHLFGWTARYNILHPTLSSLGAPDYVNIAELKHRKLRGDHINCHVPLKDAHGFTKGHVPKSMAKIPSITPYFLELMSEFKVEYQDLDVWYYGTHYNGRVQCREPVLNDGAGESAVAQLKKIAAPPYVEEFMKAPGIRCPCPMLPTTPDPDDDSVTADPSRLHGRLLHASHMALAWMLLVPLSIFVVRYYKETFSLVFCVQEYWWFGWHVGLLFASAVFIMGGILSVVTRKDVKIVVTNELVTHKIMGSFSIILFYIQIFTGFIRSEDYLTRFRQIFAHWILGILNQVIAVVSIIMMGFAKESGMSCNALITTSVWFVFYVTMFVIMEIHMRAVDKRMELEPKRTYAPPPMKRLFGRDAPRRNFRIVMLGIFLIVMIMFYFLMAYFIWSSEGVSCQDETSGNGTDSGGDGGDTGAEKQDDSYENVE